MEQHNTKTAPISILILLLCIMVTSCNEKTTLGYLEVNAPSYGSYEIYKFELGANRSLVSEQSGVFNEKIPLAPGNYLVLADCSSESIIIHPHKTKSLTAHQVDFTPPFIPHAGDSFSIQCSRSNDIKSRQQFSNKYSFNVLHGNRDPLVSLVPFNIKIKRQLKHYTAKTLIDTQASYIAQIVKHPESTFTSAYFMAILRNKQETKAKQIYNEEYRAGIEKAAIIMPSLLKNDYECAQIILLEIIEAQNKGSPSQVLLHLESVAWALIKCCGPSSLTNLWQHVQDAASHSLSISLHFWQQANEYLCERLGDGVKAPKEGRKMPAVKSLHQESASNTKPEYIMGHSFQAMSLLTTSRGYFYATPFISQIHEGVVESNRDQRTLLDKMILMLNSVAISQPFYLVCDAYYASGKIILPLLKVGQHLISRVRINAVAYLAPQIEQRGMGRPKLYGRKIRLRDILANTNQMISATDITYGSPRRSDFESGAVA